jgi:glycosyltransferase involved in cell wall biosynthesis
VAFDAGGISEWLIDGFNGFLVPWMDRRVFAMRVEELLRNKTLARRMGEYGQQFVTRQYGFSDYITNLEEMFARVAAEARQPVSP